MNEKEREIMKGERSDRENRTKEERSKENMDY